MSEGESVLMLERQVLASLDPSVRGASQDLEAISAAVARSQAVIDFDLQGKVLDANRSFLHLSGYSASEVIGKNHRIFCEPEYTATNASFWEKLRRVAA